MYRKAFPGTNRVVRASVADVGGGGSTFAQGELFTFTGSGFGTRSDYNVDGYTYEGHSHLHYRWMTFPNAMPADGSSQATFLAALDGGFPAEEFAFSGSPSSYGLTLQSGGPSQSGRYLRKVGASFADPGALEVASDSNTGIPNAPGLYMCWKHRGTGAGKIFRWWKSGTGSSGQNWYIGNSGVFREDSYWSNVIDATAFNSFDRGGGTTWVRYEVHGVGGTGAGANPGTVIYTDGAENTYEAYNGGTPITPDPSKLPLINTTENHRGTEFNWPNSTDSGDTQEFADIFLDFTWARVEITGANGKVEIQPANAWADGSITIICNKGEMNAGTGTLRVYSASNAVLHSRSVTVT